MLASRSFRFIEEQSQRPHRVHGPRYRFRFLRPSTRPCLTPQLQHSLLKTTHLCSTPLVSNPSNPSNPLCSDHQPNFAPETASKRSADQAFEPDPHAAEPHDMHSTDAAPVTLAANDQPEARTSKKKKVSREPAASLVENDEGDSTNTLDMESDVHAQDIEEFEPTILNKTRPTADVDHFFQPAAKPELPKGDKKKRSFCKSCMTGAGGCVKKNTLLFAETTTQRRHLEYAHEGLYRKWSKANNFESMLPKDRQRKRAELADAVLKLQQTNVTSHFDVAPAKEPQPETYSDELFKEVAIEWLIETNQPIQAFEHPSFKRMIELAARATRGIQLPSRKQTRAEILRMFKEQMKGLSERLNSKAVTGEVSLTCDAWQADNADGYFSLNTSHNGEHRGQALYKICDRLHIVHKIGHITCDNASNNDTMLKEFARSSCYRLKTGQSYNVSERHIHFLAHIINLATQELISTRSRAKYVTAQESELLMDDVSVAIRDEIALARSSSQRKQMFKDLQINDGTKPCMLILDMEVRWSSTFLMLYRAELLHKKVC
ncbi:hypothetical protein CVT24_002947 [Panaeolus cyanescens]|uniref:Uncharacterized protein n=1 Tax=Panaeolus cyanescens TaxID=181874 RepID=A0A409X3V9_9AGAR|nr:hypothetical protein CVT24_002947 [Panaeolus cyanescens]